jgi:hypothetical protein
LHCLARIQAIVGVLAHYNAPVLDRYTALYNVYPEGRIQERYIISAGPVLAEGQGVTKLPAQINW